MSFIALLPRDHKNRATRGSGLGQGFEGMERTPAKVGRFRGRRSVSILETLPTDEDRTLQNIFVLQAGGGGRWLRAMQAYEAACVLPMVPSLDRFTCPIYRNASALEGSLKRLGVDYVDLYWMHIWDGVTPVEEIVQTLGDLVRSGKIRYYALSDAPAWFAMKAATIAAERRIPGPIALQLEYSLVARDIEREHIPAAYEAGMAVMPWSPLAGGFLTGKYRREDTSETGRLSGPNPFGDSKFHARNWSVLDALRGVAAEQDRNPAQVALAWTMARPGVSSTIVGARTLAQLTDNIAASDLELSADQMERLNTASATPPGFTDSLAAPAVRRMVFGGNSVRGWADP